MTCAEQGCKKPSRARGVCISHYDKMRLREESEYLRRGMRKCVKCKSWTANTSYCVPCRVLIDAIKRDGWRVTELEFSTYYRREVGNVVVRIYEGPSVHWEMDGEVRFRYGRAKSVVDVMRRVRENESKIKAREARKKAWFEQD